MDIISTEIKDVLLLKPSFFNDSRGYFFESYNQNLLSKHSFNIDFVQQAVRNTAASCPNVYFLFMNTILFLMICF